MAVAPCNHKVAGKMAVDIVLAVVVVAAYPGGVGGGGDLEEAYQTRICSPRTQKAHPETGQGHPFVADPSTDKRPSLAEVAVVEY